MTERGRYKVGKKRKRHWMSNLLWIKTKEKKWKQKKTKRKKKATGQWRWKKKKKKERKDTWILFNAAYEKKKRKKERTFFFK